VSGAAIGITLQPERRYLDLLEPVFVDDADYYVMAPETLWRRDGGQVLPNDYRRRFRALGDRTGKPFVAHAVAGSLGTVDPDDRRRQDGWLRLVAEDHATFAFQWFTDHLGASVLDGRFLALPIALPMSPAMAAVVRSRLVELQRVVADAGFENSAFYFVLGDWLDEPAFFAEILRAPRTHLLLDLHNVFTMASNLSADAGEYLRRLDCARVIEIHLAGGSRSEPGWLPGGRTLRLDSHDDAIPEEVWRLFEQTAPRCTNLRGVTIERMEGTVDEGDVDGLRRELRRAREVLRAGG
jgi:uncharacterized protein (UPF0276 family)